MPIRFWPRTIRWQMLAGLILLEVLSLGLFATLLIRQQNHDVHRRIAQRLAHETSSLAAQAKEALLQQRPRWVELSVKIAGESPSVAFAKITDPVGNILYVSAGEPEQVKLTTRERALIPTVHYEDPKVFVLAPHRVEAVQAIYTGNNLRGFAWVETNSAWDREQLSFVLGSTALFGIVWTLASALLVLLIANSISQPLAVLHEGTRALMSTPEGSGNFPLPVTVRNELGDLIEAFNRMVVSIGEQRSGLNDTLSLLDSMLANAPIGLAFFDHRCRFVRVNQVFANMTGVPLSRHLGRTLPELFAQPVAQELEDAVLRVFAEEDLLRNQEFSGQAGKPSRPWTWLVSAYPVRTTPQQVRWVGLIVLDASERKRSEDALRKTEKLAATGRLAASVAHEINNPLEAITNLLFLLRSFCQLDSAALKYVEMAQHEASRIAELTQQTLRFYRQSTLPTRVKVAELLDSVLGIFRNRMSGMTIQVVRKYDTSTDLFCYAGEIRQVFANLIGNALDASKEGGRLVVRARRSQNWLNPAQNGVRFTVADTGEGMESEVLQRVFEAFFTTKEETGTGLGLWVSHEIIVKHGGLVHLRSRSSATSKTSGTVFQLFFPDNAILEVTEDSTGTSQQKISV